MLVFTAMTGKHPEDLSNASSHETLEHLDAILRSPAFISSRRCQDFLRFVVREKMEGRAESLKERTIAVEVFGKGSRFEPGEDSLVRVKAREVRKRLAEFYESAPESALRIDLPLGGYVPRIEVSPKAASPIPDTIKSVAVPAELPDKNNKFLNRRQVLWSLGGSVGVLSGFSAFSFLHQAPSPLESLWHPVFATKTPLLIFIPLLKNNGTLSERVGMGTTVSACHAAEYMTRNHYPYHLRFGTDMTFSQLREQPSLLLGGFSSRWTARITRGLRFNLVENPDGTPGGSILDTQSGTTWGPINTKNGYTDEDYAVLCRLFDSTSGQIIFLAAGISTFGTESAADFFFNPSLFSELVKQAPKDWERKNFQAIIHISIVGTTPSTPKLVATHFW